MKFIGFLCALASASADAAPIQRWAIPDSYIVWEDALIPGFMSAVKAPFRPLPDFGMVSAARNQVFDNDTGLYECVENFNVDMITGPLLESGFGLQGAGTTDFDLTVRGHVPPFTFALRFKLSCLSFLKHLDSMPVLSINETEYYYPDMYMNILSFEHVVKTDYQTLILFGAEAFTLSHHVFKKSLALNFYGLDSKSSIELLPSLNSSTFKDAYDIDNYTLCSGFRTLVVAYEPLANDTARVWAHLEGEDVIDTHVQRIRAQPAYIDERAEPQATEYETLVTLGKSKQPDTLVAQFTVSSFQLYDSLPDGAGTIDTRRMELFESVVPDAILIPRHHLEDFVDETTHHHSPPPGRDIDLGGPGFQPIDPPVSTPSTARKAKQKGISDGHLAAIVSCSCAAVFIVFAVLAVIAYRRGQPVRRRLQHNNKNAPGGTHIDLKASAMHRLTINVSKLPKYEKEGLCISTGYFGSVYLIEWQGQLAVLKVFDFDQKAASVAGDYAKELGVMARLDHANIVRLLGHGVDIQRSRGYLLMELMNGLSLADMLYPRVEVIVPASSPALFTRAAMGVNQLKATLTSRLISQKQMHPSFSMLQVENVQTDASPDSKMRLRQAALGDIIAPMQRNPRDGKRLMSSKAPQIEEPVVLVSVGPIVLSASLDSEGMGDGAYLHAAVSTLLGSAPTLAFKDRLSILVQTFRACHYLHTLPGRRIVHSDLKPANILLDRELRVRLGDVGGLSLILELPGQQSFLETAHCQGRTGGTSGYRDPYTQEDAAERRLGEKNDVYAFGACMAELLDPTIVRQIPSDMAERLKHLTERCVSNVWENRPSSAELMETLEGLLRDCAGQSEGQLIVQAPTAVEPGSLRFVQDAKPGFKFEYSTFKTNASPASFDALRGQRSPHVAINVFDVAGGKSSLYQPSS